jgi:hypothetical protein
VFQHLNRATTKRKAANFGCFSSFFFLLSLKLTNSGLTFILGVLVNTKNGLIGTYAKISE